VRAILIFIIIFHYISLATCHDINQARVIHWFYCFFNDHCPTRWEFNLEDVQGRENTSIVRGALASPTTNTHLTNVE